MATRSRLVIVGVALAVAAIPWATAGTISLAWSPVAGASGYRVYYGRDSGSYTSSHDVGNASQATLTGLADCTAYFLAVKAYNGAGESAGFSNEVTGWARPVISAAVPGARMQGDEALLEIQGANFRPGATVEIDNAHVGLASATVVGCDRIQVEMAVAPAAQNERPAEIGEFTVGVVNTDGTFGERAAALEVLVNPARFDVNRSDPTTRDRIDGRDTVWMARLFGTQENLDALYDPDFDLDGNGWVDGADLAYVASNLGRCWSGSAWTADACAAAR